MEPFQQPTAELGPDPLNPLAVGGLGASGHSVAAAALAEAIVAATCCLWHIDLGLTPPFRKPITTGSGK